MWKLFSIAMCYGLCLGFSFTRALAIETIRVPEALADSDLFCRGLLKLALDSSGAPYEIELLNDEGGTLTRHINRLKSNYFSVIWTGTSEELEEDLLPIRIPLFKGLMAHRILLIRPDDQQRFDGVKTLADIQAIKYGQGASWSDTKIMEANNLEVVTTVKYRGLFHMLDGGRFDAFPRGIHQIWAEKTRIEDEEELEFGVEKNLILVYRMPMYFFVNKKNENLSQILESGLTTAIANGEFDRFFFNNPVIRDLLTKTNLKTRKQFTLSNPNMPALTPLENESLWLDPSKL